MSTVPTLKYFAFRGRALAARIALFNSLGREGWNDERLSLPRFKKNQKAEQLGPARVNAEYITNNLPQLDLPCGTKVSQSHAIARYAARLTPSAPMAHHDPELYPTDPTRALLVDEAIATVDQILLLTPKEADEAARARSREAYQATGFLRVGLELLEGRIASSGGPFLLGDQITIADLYIRSPLCDLFDLKQFDGVGPDFIEQFPHVQACGAAVLEHPLLAAYKEAGYKS
jgi:glutathione S-transferase